MQDQYATTYGGLNIFQFYKKKVDQKKIILTQNLSEDFNNHLHLFYTGINRQAHKILSNIKKGGNQFVNYEKLSNLAENFEKELMLGNFINCGKILHENWMLKKNSDQSVSSLNLDKIYSTALNSGAVGGKLLGAGGGGYFLFLAKPSNKKKLIKSLSKLEYINFKFTKKGSEVFTI
jgi:D-glycero-alpha-D-manno-heptose-7-phosphate kinase